MKSQNSFGLLKVSELRFAEAILEGRAPTEAARRAGYGSPKQRGWELIRRPRVRQYLAMMLEVQGINHLFLASRIRAIIDDPSIAPQHRVEAIKLGVQYMAMKEGKTIEQYVGEGRSRRGGLLNLLG